MKKFLSLLILLFVFVSAWGQTVVEQGSVLQNTSQAYIKNQSDSVNMRVYWYFGAGKYAIRVPRWQDILALKGDINNIIAANNIPAGPITSLPSVGFNPGTNISAADFIKNTFYQTQPPTATLTGGQVRELSVSSFTHSLSYSYGRQSATANISTAVINPGSFNVFSTQPSQPGVVSGTQSVTTAANVNTTYTLLVTTIDGKTATATTSDTWLPGRYWGRSSISVPDNTIVLAVAGGGTDLSSSRAKSGFVVTSSGSNRIFYAYPSSYGALSSLTIGGFESLPAFTQSILTLTNASGYTQQYFVYTSNNTFSATTPTIIAQ
jgi:hypothetical protein